jgi:hypothetical protein
VVCQALLKLAARVQLRLAEQARLLNETYITAALATKPTARREILVSATEVWQVLSIAAK